MIDSKIPEFVPQLCLELIHNFSKQNYTQVYLMFHDHTISEFKELVGCVSVLDAIIQDLLSISRVPPAIPPLQNIMVKKEFEAYSLSEVINLFKVFTCKTKDKLIKYTCSLQS